MSHAPELTDAAKGEDTRRFNVERLTVTAHQRERGAVLDTHPTGSFNFTKAAQGKNAENLLIIRDPALAAQYTQN
jgi:hypothetical protein